MGLFSTLFRSDGDRSQPSIRVRESNADRDKVVGDRYTHVEGDKHGHESYTLDRASGSYREYSGGENSGDRSYNKESGDQPGKSP